MVSLPSAWAADLGIHAFLRSCALGARLVDTVESHRSVALELVGGVDASFGRTLIFAYESEAVCRDFYRVGVTD